ncbi:MAG TPA: alpha/beta fold hydrolase [Anaeromyxobacter sp.]|nr:alpha/beta fold hydrolase [Anaeromyxobacter sp.]
MLTPHHSFPSYEPAIRHEAVSFPGEGITLRGWFFPADHPRGTVIFLHGRNQNRSAATVVAQRLVPRGWEVLAYDSRAHGESGGRFSTFGYWERRDLSRAIDFLGKDRVVAMGVSLGGAVAIQAAADDPRIAEVISISAFASMREVVRERFPPLLAPSSLGPAFRAAEALGNMRVDGADTVAAARQVRVPTLVLHGAEDRFVPPEHAAEIQAALPGESALVLVPGAGHDDVLASEEAWRAITSWLEGPPLSPGRLSGLPAPGTGITGVGATAGVGP